MKRKPMSLSDQLEPVNKRARLAVSLPSPVGQTDPDEHEINHR